MTLMDDTVFNQNRAAGFDETAAFEKTVTFAAFCPIVRQAGAAAQAGTPATLTESGAYTDDVLRIVRGTPNAEELAALVAALLLTRRAHADAQGPDTDHHTTHQKQHRPGWLRDRYTAPGSWTAGP